jgi:hypothetical protein
VDFDGASAGYPGVLIGGLDRIAGKFYAAEMEAASADDPPHRRDD